MSCLSGRWKWGRWKSNDGTGAQQEMDGSTVGSIKPVEVELVGIIEIEQDKAEIATEAKVE